jgi:hypothetical protein
MFRDRYLILWGAVTTGGRPRHRARCLPGEPGVELSALIPEGGKGQGGEDDPGYADAEAVTAA